MIPLNLKINTYILLLTLIASFTAAVVTVANDTGTTSYQTVLTMNLTSNDNGTNVRVGELGTPSHGTVTLNDDGTINYTATPGYIGVDTFNYTALENGLFYNGTGHYYEFVTNATISWSNANISASNRTMSGLRGYLATINSTGENDFAATKLLGDGWIGASDTAVENTWKWVTGPEAGTHFWTGLSGGSTVGGNYQNWADGEPNNAGNEDYGEIYSSGGGGWNDLPDGATPGGFVVEYGGMPGDSLNIANGTVTITVTDAVKPQLNFLSSTVANNTITTSRNVTINATISEYNLKDLKLNWNAANYTLYDDNLVLSLNFNNESSIGENSTYVVDTSSKGNNGTASGATWTSSGKFNGAYTFDGVDDYINLGTSTSLLIQGNFSSSTWIKADPDVTVYRMVYGNEIVGVNASHRVFVLANDGRVNFDFSVNNIFQNTRSNTYVNDSRWHNVIAVRDDSIKTVKLYVDGVLENTTTYAGTVDRPLSGLYVGISPIFGGTYPFKGSIDDLRIYNRTLTTSEVSQIYATSLERVNASSWRLQANETSLADGNYTYQVLTTDSSLNFNQSAYRLTTVDTTNPAITIASPANTTYENINVALNVAANETISTWWYSLNGSSNVTFTPNTTLSNLAYQQHNVTVYANDTSGHVGSTTVWFTALFVDNDGDSIADWNDTLEGNTSVVTTSGISDLNVTVDSSDANGSFSNVKHLTFYDGTTKLLNFSHNFTASELNLSQVTITLSTRYIIVNLSQQLQIANYNKSLYLTDNAFISLCVKNGEIASISEISSNCNAVDEIDFTTCISNNTGVTINGITCIDEGSRFKVDNLTYSAILGTPATTSSSSASGGGYGGYSRNTTTNTTNQTAPVKPTVQPQVTQSSTQRANAYENETIQTIEEAPIVTSKSNDWWIFVVITLVIATFLFFLLTRKKKKKEQPKIKGKNGKYTIKINP